MKDRIITNREIEEILEKYNIGKKPLSLLLGWGEITIIRYLDGGIPDKLHSDVLFSIKKDPNKMLEYLEANKNLITDVAYKKVVSRIEQLSDLEDKETVYLVAKHIIAVLGDTTPLALQKILYYIEGFSLALLNKSILNCSFEAWVHGPVCRKIYDHYSYYKFHIIDRSNFSKYEKLELVDEEVISLVDEVIQSFGCYSGKILEKMTHLSSSWINARGVLGEEEVSSKVIDKNEMIEEFKNICEKYHISDYSYISRYSNKLFRKVIR